VYAACVKANRLISLFAVLLTLPLYGLAGAAHVRDCDSASGMTHCGGAADPCCPEKGSPGFDCTMSGAPLSGTQGHCAPCEAGCHCQSAQCIEPGIVLLERIAPIRSDSPAHATPFPPSRSPDGLWRPPRLA